MRWMNEHEQKLGIELGFVVRHGSREGQLINVSVSQDDPAGTNPSQGNIRPASSAEVKMWAALLGRVRSNG